MDYTLVDEAVAQCLQEDIGPGDISSLLINVKQQAIARVLLKETAVLCGKAWFESCFRQVDSSVSLHWLVNEGQLLDANTPIVEICGAARSLLTAERTALNWLQTLSATATAVRNYQQLLSGTHVTLRDTRKTIPGLRYAQKYAVRCGGGSNHRMGLYDQFLIKENHIISCGSITNAVQRARQQHPDCVLEVEVETLDELREAILAGADVILLDNFDLPMIQRAVAIPRAQIRLEVSGDVNVDTISAIAHTGVDYIAVGALTKHVKAIDFSMRFAQVCSKVS